MLNNQVAVCMDPLPVAGMALRCMVAKVAYWTAGMYRTYRILAVRTGQAADTLGRWGGDSSLGLVDWDRKVGPNHVAERGRPADNVVPRGAVAGSAAAADFVAPVLRRDNNKKRVYRADMICQDTVRALSRWWAAIAARE